MKIVSTLYKNKDVFKGLVESKQINVQDECLVRIYTAICTKEEAIVIAQELKGILPKAHIIGSSGSGIIYDGNQYGTETLVIVEQYERTSIEVSVHTFFEKKAIDLVSEIANQIEGKNVPLMHLLCGDHYYDIHRFIMEFNKRNSMTKLVGGIVGDILPRNIQGYVFTEKGVVDHGIVTAALCSEDLYTYNDVNIAHDPISPVYEINKCEGSLILEIDQKPAVEWCREQFGLRELKSYTDWQVIADNDEIVRFPIVLEGHNGASRILKYDPDFGKMSLYFSEIDSHTKFRIGYTSPTKCVQESLDLCHRIVDTPVESLFCYTCLFRKLYLENCAEWELSPFNQSGICGVFMMGEIGYVNERNEFLNGSCCLVGVAEEEVYVEPNFSVFEDLNKIKDDTQWLSNYVLRKQSSAMSIENQQLMDKLLVQQEMSKQQLYRDVNLGLENNIKYALDQVVHHYDKMCMIHIENCGLLVSRFGRTGYYRLVKKAIKQAGAFLSTQMDSDKLNYYVHNDSTLYIVANYELNQETFMRIIETLYSHFQFIKLEGKDEILINRFVIVLNQKDLLEKGLATLTHYQNVQTNFLVFDNSEETNKHLEHEMKMLQILNQVVENDRVIPYFQGIHDNNQRVINKYEALMRIQDDEGVIYNPYEFLGIAKKYHLYASLSMMMIRKVFSNFAGKESVVTVNLSADDINVKEIRHQIYDLLDQLGDASNIIFEILEDEELRDMEVLREFITNVRTYGVKIAIDDFGSGYSNFMEIIKIEPDFIKVDGNIVKDIETTAINEKVLENIVFLGKQLNATIVAEYVENEMIQEKIEALGIRYSQGFHFARPLPYEELGG